MMTHYTIEDKSTARVEHDSLFRATVYAYSRIRAGAKIVSVLKDGNVVKEISMIAGCEHECEPKLRTYNEIMNAREDEFKTSKDAPKKKSSITHP